MFADVIIDISAEALDRTFQYRIPEILREQVKLGTPVSVPFGRNKKLRQGYVVNISAEPSFDPSKIKEIVKVEKNLVSIKSQSIQLAGFIRDRYGTTMNEALKTVIPVKKKIKNLEEVFLTLRVNEEEARARLSEYRRKNHKAKERLLEAICDNEVVTSRDAKHELNISKSTIDALVKDGVINVDRERKYRNVVSDNVDNSAGEKILNTEQQFIVDDFKKEYLSGVRRPYYIYGITGSGKTEVYINIIKDVVAQGKQVIVLIPEISLTFQTVARFKNVFGDRVSVLHSKLSEGERYDQYDRAQRGELDIMIGPRSALFTPFSDLGLIVMDEEHDGGYISDRSPKYHSDEVALFRAEMTGASVVFGSATPSVKAYLKMQKGIYKTYRLDKRAGNAKLPSVSVVDLREEFRSGNRSILSELLQEKICDRLNKGEQTILFLNRRGYASFVSCRNCGNVIQCSHCDISLKAHKDYSGRIKKLMCHYCGDTVPMPEKCPKCGKPYIGTFGMGTQKVEEMLQKRLPNARIMRMDADTTAGKRGHERIIEEFRAGRADILIGTQMIVKGHDFPGVTLVAALAADMSMFDNDYQSMERTFQLLHQASGRAGRGDKEGEVIIQTYSPDNYVIKSVKAQDPSIFYENELAYRNLMNYPPYQYLLMINISGNSKGYVEKLCSKLAGWINKNYEGIKLIGPNLDLITKRNDKYVMDMYLKSEEQERLIGLKEDIQKEVEGSRLPVRIQFEIK
ncbi:MAG: primosomal protein N' [Eubacterium sp.]|nr:primosomal protein N' [Eubacterium sp.]